MPLIIYAKHSRLLSGPNAKSTPPMPYSNDLTKALNIRHPLVMAPMFLVSNLSMIKEAIESGILGCFPTLNYRKEDELKGTLVQLNDFIARRKGAPGNYGVNLIVQKANPWAE